MKNTYEISFKLRYCETEEWGKEILKATTKNQALNSFAKSRKIRTKEFKSFEDWSWEEGVWLARFKNINQVEVLQCPHCDGTGIIPVQNMFLS